MISMFNWGGRLGVKGRYQVGDNKDRAWWRNLFADSVGFVLAEQLTDMTDAMDMVMVWFVPAV